MNQTTIVFLGPQASKAVAGFGEFIKDEPREVPSHKAKSILTHWPGLFAVVQTAEDPQLRADYDKACETIASMHAAAVGEVTGPKLGVVEDVEAVRAELHELHEQNAALKDANVRLSAQVTDLEARVEALLAGEHTPPPAIDPANPLDEPDPGAEGPASQPQEPADAPKRGRTKSVPEAPKE